MKRFLAYMLAVLMLTCAAALADEVESALRGRTLIVHMPDAWVQDKLQAAGPHSGWWGDDGFSWTWKGSAAEWMLGRIAGENPPETGGASKPQTLSGSYYPEYGDDQEFEMSLTRTGDGWYSVMRLAKAPEQDVNLLYELCELDYALENGTLRAEETGCVELTLALQPENMAGVQALFSGGNDDIRIDLFPALGAAVAVITERDADRDLLQDVQLMIGEAAGPLLNGYMDGRDAVYCCVLTGAEAAKVQAGDGISLYRRPLSLDARYEDTPYAVVRKGTGNYGVIDRTGAWAVQPEYEYISRPDVDRNNWDTPRPFFCRTGSSLVVRHGETLQVIVELQGEAEHSYNPALFATYDNAGTSVYSAATGEKLFDTTGAFASIGGELQDYVGMNYFHRVEGYPQRLVIQRGPTGDSRTYSYLADNQGNYIAGDYQFITPLMWVGDRGLFLTQGNAEYPLDHSAVEFGRDGTYTRPATGGNSGWRCGLINENGNTIAPCSYAGLRIISRDEVQLLAAGGSWESFRWLE